MGVLCLMVVVVASFFLYQKLSLKKNQKEEIVQEEEVSFKKMESKEENYIKVDIKGEVVLPGIYSLVEGSRVIDVIAMAGGLGENADTSVVNLSKKIYDEMVIIIYSRDQVAHFYETKQQEKNVLDQCRSNEEYALVNDACIQEEVDFSSKININRASVEELMTLPGIGEAKAKDIIAYREEVGPFQTIEDIMNVHGIGESVYSQIKENIIV